MERWPPRSLLLRQLDGIVHHQMKQAAFDRGLTLQAWCHKVLAAAARQQLAYKPKRRRAVERQTQPA